MNEYLIHLHTKQELLTAWERARKQLNAGTGVLPVCLRCGRSLRSRIEENALSRALDVYICPECGMDEGLRDATGEVLPIQKWHAIEQGYLPVPEFGNQPVLVPTCSFEQIYAGEKKTLPLSSVEYPVSLIAYSRSDYDGRQWWTNWFGREEDRPSMELMQEIDGFQNALLELWEFQSLRSMTRMCRIYAQQTSEKTEFNLYSETEHFNIWLRMITRERDYNLYVYYYLKNLYT